MSPAAGLPDAADGLTRAERVVLTTLHDTLKETGRELIPTAMLYGRVVERLDMSQDELQAIRSLGPEHAVLGKLTGSTPDVRCTQ